MTVSNSILVGSPIACIVSVKLGIPFILFISFLYFERHRSISMVIYNYNIRKKDEQNEYYSKSERQSKKISGNA